jgi:hypothetical protein
MVVIEACIHGSKAKRARAEALEGDFLLDKEFLDALISERRVRHKFDGRSSGIIDDRLDLGRNTESQCRLSSEISIVITIWRSPNLFYRCQLSIHEGL